MLLFLIFLDHNFWDVIDVREQLATRTRSVGMMSTSPLPKKLETQLPHLASGLVCLNGMKHSCFQCHRLKSNESSELTLCFLLLFMSLFVVLARWDAGTWTHHEELHQGLRHVPYVHSFSLVCLDAILRWGSMLFPFAAHSSQVGSLYSDLTHWHMPLKLSDPPISNLMEDTLNLDGTTDGGCETVDPIDADDKYGKCPTTDTAPLTFQLSFTCHSPAEMGSNTMHCSFAFWGHHGLCQLLCTICGGVHGNAGNYCGQHWWCHCLLCCAGYYAGETCSAFWLPWCQWCNPRVAGFRIRFNASNQPRCRQFLPAVIGSKFIFYWVQVL